MARKLSAGLLLYRYQCGMLEVFLVHPGGPLWAKKDEGAWSIPKGQYQEGDDPLATAKREFHEETGSEVTGSFRALSPLRQPSGKVVSAWAVEGDIEAATVSRSRCLVRSAHREDKAATRAARLPRSAATIIGASSKQHLTFPRKSEPLAQLNPWIVFAASSSL